MKISFQAFNKLVIVLAILAVLFLPFWPYSRWGYFPSTLLAVGVVVLFMLKTLARD